MVAFVGFIVVACTALLTATPGRAAEISSRVIPQGKVVFIEGEIVAGDAARFKQMIGDRDGETAVFLSSLGGAIVEALNIGVEIHNRHFSTAVVDGYRCASACALIWLAGVNRYSGTQAKIGFHAAYTGGGDDAKESGVGNAIIGSYLTQLGLSLKAIIYMTSAAPTEMQWLDLAEARQLGIEVHVLAPIASVPAPTVVPEPVNPFDKFVTRPATPAEAKPQAAPQPGLIPVQGNPFSAGSAKVDQRLRAAAFATEYYRNWSATGTNVEGFSQYYAPTVTFFGASTPLEKLMAEKRKFAARWPFRHYEVNPTSVKAQCTEQRCTVSGVVDWDATNVERGAHSAGSARFTFELAPYEGHYVILAESGAVIAYNKS